MQVYLQFWNEEGMHKLFISKVEKIHLGRYSYQCEVLFLHKKNSYAEADQLIKCYFVYSTIPDRFLIGKDDTIQKLTSVNRGKHEFAEPTFGQTRENS